MPRADIVSASWVLGVEPWRARRTGRAWKTVRTQAEPGHEGKCVEEINSAMQSKTTDSHPAKGTSSDHFCPGCGAAQKLFPRYPWYFCQACLKLAEDGNGRRLDFGNMSFSGGLYWKYADTVEVGEEECGDVVCLIRGRPVIVTEARFGGVVAQPLHSQSNFANSHKIVDLRSPSR